MLDLRDTSREPSTVPYEPESDSGLAELPEIRGNTLFRSTTLRLINCSYLAWVTFSLPPEYAGLISRSCYMFHLHTIPLTPDPEALSPRLK